MGTEKTITLNRKARYDYSIGESMEAGIVLTGTEIKSLRAGKVSLAQSFARPERGELWLINAYIAPYEAGNRYNHEPTRPRKLLLHRDEINRLAGTVTQKGFTLVPLRLYLKKGLAKLELGLARGKKLYDKRESIAQRQAKREIERTLKTRRVKF
jgi:SsrA-binding protein